MVNQSTELRDDLPSAQEESVAALVEHNIDQLLQDREELVNRLQDETARSDVLQETLKDTHTLLQDRSRQLEEAQDQLAKNKDKSHHNLVSPSSRYTHSCTYHFIFRRR